MNDLKIILIIVMVFINIYTIGIYAPSLVSSNNSVDVWLGFTVLVLLGLSNYKIINFLLKKEK